MLYRFLRALPQAAQTHDVEFFLKSLWQSSAPETRHIFCQHLLLHNNQKCKYYVKHDSRLAAYGGVVKHLRLKKK